LKERTQMWKAKESKEFHPSRGRAKGTAVYLSPGELIKGVVTQKSRMSKKIGLSRPHGSGIGGEPEATLTDRGHCICTLGKTPGSRRT